ARALVVRPEHLQLVHPLHVEVQGSLRAVDLPLEGVAPAERETSRLDRADGAAVEVDGDLERVVDLPPRNEGANEPRDARDLTGEEAREIDDVRAQVAERA